MNTKNLTRYLQEGVDSNNPATHALAVAAREELAEILAMVVREYNNSVDKRTEASGTLCYSLILENAEIAAKFTKLAKGDVSE